MISKGDSSLTQNPVSTALTKQYTAELIISCCSQPARKLDVRPLSDLADANLDDADTGRNVGKFEKQRSLQDLHGTRKRQWKPNRGRSNSDGTLIPLDHNTEAFPSLPNSVLEKLGLYGCNNSRDNLSEMDLEQKFTSLSLAFTIDSTTIKDRCERQRRTRDQTEHNFSLEVEKLKDKLALLKPLCTDYETADLLSSLYSQVDTLTKAGSLVSIAAERYGAVQHEDRLTESVQLMVSHVQTLKQQRDSALRQLQYTKRVLQEPVDPLEPKVLPGLNRTLFNRRRASTDAVNLPFDQNLKLNRRMSDLSFKVSLAKGRQNSLGMELNKIKESTPDENVSPTPEVVKEDVDSDFEATLLSKNSDFLTEVSSVVRFKVTSCIEDLHKKLVEYLSKWSQTGYLHIFLNSCAILCFSVSILTLLRIFLEQDYSKSTLVGLFSWKKK